MIRYGYACKTIGVPGTAQTSLTLATASRERLVAVSRHNLEATRQAIEYCRQEQIPLFRLSSDIIPLASHPAVSFDWQQACRPELEQLGAAIEEGNIRISLHPGQYTVLNSPHEEVASRAVVDLIYHAQLLDALGAKDDACIILHVGGVYGDKKSAMDRFRQRCAALPAVVTRRLALENDERNFTIEDVLLLCRELGLPAVFDVFHHSLNPPQNHNGAFWLDEAQTTWPGRQKIHYSQQLAGGKGGMHSRTIYLQPFLDFHTWLGTRDVDVMLEVKDKNLSAVKCANLAMHLPPRRRLTEEWARYKYAVLERSPAHYQAIRSLLKEEGVLASRFYAQIEEALAMPLEAGRVLNAAQHVWGYVDTWAQGVERKRILNDMENLATSLTSLPGLKRKLFRLAQQHQVAYLLQSLYFYSW